jgi:hypothetical protein
MKTIQLLPFLLALVLFTGCKKDKEEDNQECESSCVGKYADSIVSCEKKAADCLATCEGPDDYDCTWDCEDLEDECTGRFYMCAGTCPCASDVPSCYRACAEGDLECATGCVDRYYDCAGEDSPYTCYLENCQVVVFQCKDLCDEMAYDSAEFAACRADCASETKACLNSCE